MDPMKLTRSVAASMARDVRQARWKVLKKLTPEEGLFLLNLHSDLEIISDMNWHDSLSRRLETGHAIIAKNMGLDEDEGLEIAKEMAADELESREMMREMIREPMTIERMKEGEDLLASKGAPINLLNRSQDTQDVHQN